MNLRPLAVVLFAGALVGSCTGPDTYYDLRTGEIFEPYGTAYDCRIAAEKYGAQTVWRGLAGGRQSLGFGQYRNISREACFPTRAQCEYWSAQMDGAIHRITTNSCRRGYRG